jgi:hypothetical protein
MCSLSATVVVTDPERSSVRAKITKNPEYDTDVFRTN